MIFDSSIRDYVGVMFADSSFMVSGASNTESKIIYPPLQIRPFRYVRL